MPLIFSLSEPVDVAHPAVSAQDPALVQSLETQALNWMTTIQDVSNRVRAAPAVHTSCSVKELPLAELEFWKVRTRQLEPLSKQAETEFMKNVTKVLMLANSENGILLRTSFASLRRLYIEAYWNAKYLKILEKPFQTLSTGPMEKIVVMIPGMVRTLKMTCVSSRFYTSVEKMDALLERVTLALCVRVADAADPARLVVNLNSAVTATVLERLVEVLTRWESCVTEPDKVRGRNRRNERNKSNNDEDDDDGETESKERAPTAWELLQWDRLLQRPRHMKQRVVELNQLFQRFHKISDRINQKKEEHTEEHTKEHTGERTGEFTATGERAKMASCETEYRAAIALLLKAASKRAHPRIGVLSTAAEGVFESRCASKWKAHLMEINNQCMALEVQLRLTTSVSYEV
jgi:hypothetical protein